MLKRFGTCILHVTIADVDDSGFSTSSHLNVNTVYLQSVRFNDFVVT